MKQKFVLKRIRTGAYESSSFLVQRLSWTSERWDGPRETYRAWKVYSAGSFIEKRVQIDAFATLRAAFEYVRRREAQKS